MPKDSHKKIALVTISLAGGGAERSVAQLSQMLSSLGHSVFIFSIRDEISYPYDGTLINIGAFKKNGSYFGKIKSLWNFRKLLKHHEIDVIIDHRTRSNSFKEKIYSSFIYRKLPLLLVAHSSNLDMYFPEKAGSIYKNVLAVIGVSEGIKERINKKFSFKKVVTIPNAIPELQGNALSQTVPSSYILSYGRLDDDVKNYKLLLDAFAKAYNSINTPLVIMGDGPDREMLQQYTETLQLKDKVLFIPFQKEPKAIIENATCVTLTSRFEGFPMVLVEALSLGVPVVSVDCVSGPSEIIRQEENGLLVENYDVIAFSNALSRMVNETELRNRMVANTKESVAHLNPASIAQKWQKLLSSIL